MKTLPFAAALLAAALLASCDQTTTTTPTETATTTDVAANDCHVTGSRDWHANVDHLPGPGAERTLHVNGKVDFPSGGYTWSFASNTVDDPTSGVVRLTLSTTAPTGPADDHVATDTPVNYSVPAGDTHYTQITVFCGRGVLATITDIPETQ